MHPVNRNSLALLCVGMLALANQTQARSIEVDPLPQTPSPTQQVAAPRTDLALYGLPLKGARLEEFSRAAGRAGAMSLPVSTEGFPVFSAAHVGVPGMEQFLVVHDGDTVLSVQFALKNDTKENQALRRLLLRK
jgi:hypothetical protein